MCLKKRHWKHKSVHMRVKTKEDAEERNPMKLAVVVKSKNEVKRERNEVNIKTLKNQEQRRRFTRNEKLAK